MYCQAWCQDSQGGRGKQSALKLFSDQPTRVCAHAYIHTHFKKYHLKAIFLYCPGTAGTSCVPHVPPKTGAMCFAADSPAQPLCLPSSWDNLVFNTKSKQTLADSSMHETGSWLLYLSPLMPALYVTLLLQLLCGPAMSHGRLGSLWSRRAPSNTDTGQQSMHDVYSL